MDERKRGLSVNELILVNVDTHTVSARELHKKVGSTERFSSWFERQLQFGFVENEDYTGCKKFNTLANQELQDYELSVDMAKHICMVQKNEKAREVRQYLIDLEKVWNSPEQVMARALKMADKTIEGLKAKLLEMKPKADFFDAVTDSKTAISMNEVAKVLNIKGYGRNNLFEFLRENKVLDRWNVPYQKYVDNGWFRVIEQHYQKNGEPIVTTKTLVYQNGVDSIRKMIGVKAHG